MNIKVVITWALAIVVFAGLGIFGFVNQDLLLEDNSDHVYVPSGNEGENAKICSKPIAGGTSSYRFNIDEATGKITKVIMTYTATADDMDAYIAASNINTSEINGVNVAMSGGVSDFVLMVTVDLAIYDVVTVEALRNDFSKLSMAIDKIDDYEMYKSAINSMAGEIPYNCD